MSKKPKIVEMPHIDPEFLFNSRISSAIDTYIHPKTTGEEYRKAGAYLHRMAGILFITAEKLENEEQQVAGHD